MKYLFTLLLIVSFSACSFMGELRDSEEVLNGLEKGFKRVEINLKYAPEINDRLYDAGVIDEKKHEANKKIISQTRDSISIIRRLIEVNEFAQAENEINNLQEAITDLL